MSAMSIGFGRINQAGHTRHQGTRFRSADFSPQGHWLAKETLEACGCACTAITFLRDESRAPFRSGAPVSDLAFSVRGRPGPPDRTSKLRWQNQDASNEVGRKLGDLLGFTQV